MLPAGISHARSAIATAPLQSALGAARADLYNAQFVSDASTARHIGGVMGRLERRDKYFNKHENCDPALRACARDTLLPSGIVRVSEEGIASSRLLPEESALSAAGKPVEVAAFDFDGTCINGSSPKRLVKILVRHNLISPYKTLRVGLWGLAYKLNLPKDPEGVRTRVFSAFKGLPAITVNDFMCRFYQRSIAALYRPDADAAMVAHLEAGHVVVLVSASFEPIIASAMVEHPIQFALASRMKIDAEGNYTDQVEGLPTEGPEKIVVLRKFLNERYGEGGWHLGWAYGDHYSDLEMLEAASNPCAVTPDQKLRRVAERRGWTVLDWDQ